MQKEPILIIDDDIESNELVLLTLEPAGYALFFALNGADGKAMAIEVNPKLIFLNISTPGASGLQTCRDIRTIPSLKDVPFILFTKTLTEYEPRYRTAYGIMDFIHKPFNQKELISKTVRTLAENEDGLFRNRRNQETASLESAQSDAAKSMKPPEDERRLEPRPAEGMADTDFAESKTERPYFYDIFSKMDEETKPSQDASDDVLKDKTIETEEKDKGHTLPSIYEKPKEEEMADKFKQSDDEAPEEEPMVDFLRKKSGVSDRVKGGGKRGTGAGSRSRGALLAVLGIVIVAAIIYFLFWPQNDIDTVNLPKKSAESGAPLPPVPPIQQKEQIVDNVAPANQPPAPQAPQPQQPQAAAQNTTKQETPKEKTSPKESVEKKVSTPDAAPKKKAEAAEVKKQKAKFYILAGTFVKEGNAKKLAKRLKNRGYDANVKKSFQKGKAAYKVIIGNFETKNEALQASKKLEKKEKIKALIKAG
ncbi:MAG: response regulator [Nitrospirae bacterium]|nr:response regulator [Nitrospirota bacterium]